METDAVPNREPLPFTDEEYSARLAAVRRNMEAAGVEVMLTAVPENIVYLTGYHSLGYFTFQLLVVPLDHPPILLVRGVARHKARIDSCLEHVIGYFDTEDPDKATYKLLSDYGLLGRRIGNQNDAWFFSPVRYQKLLDRLGVDDLPDCKFPYQGGVVFSECLAVTETGYELLSDFASEIFYKQGRRSAGDAVNRLVGYGSALGPK